MTLVELACYSVEAAFADGASYVMSGGRRIGSLASTIVKVTAADGTEGYGEACTLGGNYMDGFPGSVRAAVHQLAPVVLATHPLDAGALAAAMDKEVLGHRAAKSAIDIAMWDLRGQMLGQPVARLLGGLRQREVPAFVAVSLAPPRTVGEEITSLAAYGFNHWQLKLGDDPLIDAERVHAAEAVLTHRGRAFLTCDANSGWDVSDTLRFLAAIDGIDTYLEQPCRTLRELAVVRGTTRLPMLVDEIVRDASDLYDAIQAGCAQALNLKPTRVGGLTKAARLRDIAESAGVKVLVDEPMGGELASAAMAHLAATVDPASLLATSYMNFEGMPLTYTSQPASGVAFADGVVTVSEAPGLGVEIDRERLGEPLFVVSDDPRSWAREREVVPFAR